MTDKAKLVEPRLPRGFEDRTPADIAAVGRMLDVIKSVYERYGFDPLETPLLEYTEALGKFLPDTDRPNAGVFSLQDDDEQWMSLRYDLTAPLARYFAQNYDRLPKPFRSYRQGWVFRNEKPGPGRFRQFMQFDADTVGAAGPEADAEMAMMMADCMEALGLGGKYVVKVSSRRIMDGWRLAFGLNDSTHDAMWLGVMRALDKADRIGLEGVQQLLQEGRKDESGDFTKGAGLAEAPTRRLIQVLAYRSHVEVQGVTGFNPLFNTGSSPESLVAKTLTQSMRSTADYFAKSEAEGEADLSLLVESLDEVEAIDRLLVAAGYNDGRVRFDPSVVRGLEYYTGPVFEIELTFPVTNERGEQVVFGSVGGGGRYDGLVSRFRSEPVPATGFSIGVSRLAQALKLTGNLPEAAADGPVVVLVMDRDQTASYQAMVSELRNAGIRAEMYLGSSGMNAQMKYANRRNSPAVVIEGSMEREKGEVTIKDMVAGAEASKQFTDNAEMKAARPAQFNVSREGLVEGVRRVLGAGA